jgi:hypothetical protein
MEKFNDKYWKLGCRNYENNKEIQKMVGSSKVQMG